MSDLSDKIQWFPFRRQDLGCLESLEFFFAYDEANNQARDTTIRKSNRTTILDSVRMMKGLDAELVAKLDGKDPWDEIGVGLQFIWLDTCVLKVNRWYGNNKKVEGSLSGLFLRMEGYETDGRLARGDPKGNSSTGRPG